MDQPARRAARSSRPDRHEERLRSRPVRRLHGAGGRAAHQLVSDARGDEGRLRRHDDRRSGGRRRAASAAECLYRARRVSVRLLHAGTDLFGGRPARGGQGEDRGRGARADERQHLPLRRLSEHRGGDPPGDERSAIVINFAYTRANGIAEAVRAATADPNAKFIAGGTNLIDLMKEDVERPTRLIDITQLPLKAVEETPDGGLKIGALVPNSDLAYHPIVEGRYPLLASAILAGASTIG